MSVQYILQQDDSCCLLYALCNALRFFGKPSAEPGTEEWERLVDFAKCRHGSVIDLAKVSTSMGLRCGTVFPEDARNHAPAIWTVWNPVDKGSALHAALYIGGHEDVEVVNYHYGTGPVIETLPWSAIATELRQVYWVTQLNP